MFTVGWLFIYVKRSDLKIACNCHYSERLKSHTQILESMRGISNTLFKNSSDSIYMARE